MRGIGQGVRTRILPGEPHVCGYTTSLPKTLRRHPLAAKASKDAGAKVGLAQSAVASSVKPSTGFSVGIFTLPPVFRVFRVFRGSSSSIPSRKTACRPRDPRVVPLVNPCSARRLVQVEIAATSRIRPSPFRNSQIVDYLQFQPELRRRTKGLSKQPGSLRCNRASSAANLVDTAHRHTQMICQCRLCQVQPVQETPPRGFRRDERELPECFRRQSSGHLLPYATLPRRVKGDRSEWHCRLRRKDLGKTADWRAWRRFRTPSSTTRFVRVSQCRLAAPQRARVPQLSTRFCS